MHVKRLILVLLISSSIVAAAQSAASTPKPQSYSELVKQAYALYEAGKFKAALIQYEKAFAMRKPAPVDLYNAACSAALINKKTKAITLLTASIQNGYRKTDHLQKDTDLDILHRTADWSSLVKATQDNEDKFSDEAIIQTIKDHLFTFKKHEELYSMCSDSFKIRTPKAALEKITDDIWAMKVKFRLQSFNEFSVSSSSRSGITNGVHYEGRTFEYGLTPDFFGERTATMLRHPVGFHITIDLTRGADGNLWLEELTFKDDMIYGNRDINEPVVRKFLANDSECVALFGMRTKENALSGYATIKPGALNVNFADIQFDHNAFAHGWDKKTSHVYYTTFMRDNPTQQSGFPSAEQIFGNKKAPQPKARPVDFLEFLYYADLDVVLVSNGDEYGFYTVKNPTALKELMQDKLLKSLNFQPIGK